MHLFNEIFKSGNWGVTDFTMQSAYKVLVHQYHQATTVSLKFLWHKDVPLKVVLFAWRLFRDRLPTKDNLFRRGVIAFEARFCVGGCGEMETSPIYFYIVIFLGKFGTLFTVGWVSARSFLVYPRLISISMVMLVVIVLRCGTLLCS